MANEVKNENNGSKNLIYKILLVVFLIALIVCIGMMAHNWWKEKKAQEQFENFVSTETESEGMIETETEDVTETEMDILTQLGITVPEKTIDWEGLWAVNEHVYAWIYIPNTNIDYPVLQHPTDDSRYLNYNMDGTKGYPGCIYSEHRYNSKDFMDFNTALYGHDMKNGTMFKTLHNFEDSTFFDENRYAYIYMPSGDVYVYDIFAAYVSTDRHIMVYYDYLSAEGCQEYLDDVFGIRDMSAHFREGIEVTTDSHILTMITCISGKPSNRYFVQGVLVNPPTVEETVTEQ